MAKNFAASSTVRGMRNNNPGNLIITGTKWLGKVANSTDGKFEQFINMKYGLRALMLNLKSSVKKGNDTINKLISVYAPAFENKTSVYVADVAQTLGIATTDKLTLDKAQLVSLSKAIVYVENGATAAQRLDDSDYIEAYNALSDTKVTNGLTGKLASVLIPIALFFYTIGAFTGLTNENKSLTIKNYHYAKDKRLLCEK